MRDDEWDDDEFARRLIVHITGRKPTRAQIRNLLKVPLSDWEQGARWGIEELHGWANEHRP